MWSEVLDMVDPVNVDYSTVEKLFSQKERDEGAIKAQAQKKKKEPSEVRTQCICHTSGKVA